ncbi:hypothetical protein SGRIM128S_09398 [Streptomyces griseomycini]
MPMVRSEATRVPLRPIRSPRCPKTTAPIGRATIAAPNTAKDDSRAVVGSLLGKKSLGKTRTAAVA